MLICFGIKRGYSQLSKYLNYKFIINLNFVWNLQTHFGTSPSVAKHPQNTGDVWRQKDLMHYLTCSICSAEIFPVRNVPYSPITCLRDTNALMANDNVSQQIKTDISVSIRTQVCVFECVKPQHFVKQKKNWMSLTPKFQLSGFATHKKIERIPITTDNCIRVTT